MSVCVYVHACFPPHSLCAHLSICLCLLTQIGIQEHRQKENGRRRKKISHSLGLTLNATKMKWICTGRNGDERQKARPREKREWEMANSETTKQRKKSDVIEMHIIRKLTKFKMKLFDENDLVSVCALSYTHTHIIEWSKCSTRKKEPMRR